MSWKLSERAPRRAQILSDWAREVLSAFGWIVCFGAILAVLFIEFPNGLADLGDIHFRLVAGH
jgi:hypothetical protein